MTWAQPFWFWGFALFPILLVLFIRNERKARLTLQKLVATRLIDRLAGSVSPAKRRFRFALLLAGLACILVALAQPRLGFTWQERTSKGRDVIIAIDTSRSMLANDLAPNRLTRAKLAAEDLIGQLQGDRVGLIAFAGSAFLQAPLTADHSAVLGALHEIDTEIIPRGGTNIAEAIRTALEAFGKGESDNRALVIFTDGEELDANGITAAKDQKEIARIFTVGVGSAEGTIIPLGGRDGQAYVTDNNGQVVKSKLDEERLHAIAEAAGGFYLRLQNGPAEMRQIVREGLGFMNERDINTAVSRQPIERYQWPLGSGIILLAFTLFVGERRRRAVAPVRAAQLAAVLLAFAFMGGRGYADTPADLFQAGKYNDAQQAYAEMLKENPGSDRLAFNHGAAAYKNRDFKTALEAFGKAVATTDPGLRAQAEYNLGNTLFQQAVSNAKKPDVPTLKSALEHFDQARQIASDKANAQYNYDVTKKLIEDVQKKQEEEQKKQDQQKKDQKQDQKDQKDQKDKNKDQQKQDQGKQDQQKKDGDKDQQQPGQGEQDKQDQKDGQKKQDQEGKDGDQKPDQQKDGKQPQPDQKDGKGDPKDRDQNGGKEGEQQKPEPQPGQDNPAEQQQARKDGELKNNPIPGEPTKEQKEQQQEAENAAAAAEGRMTEAQAKSLLDSMKSEDARVQLLNPRDRRTRERPLRDW